MPTQAERWNDIQAERRINTNDRAAIDAETDALVAELLAAVEPPVPTFAVTIGLDRTIEQGKEQPFVAAVTGGVGPFTYDWDFGDGTTGTGLSTAHTYAASSVFLVEFTATDADGKTASDTAVVTVTPAPVVPPVAFDPTKTPVILSVKDDGDGGMTFTMADFPGRDYFQVSVVSEANVYTTWKVPAPALQYRWIPAIVGTWRLAVSAFGKVNGVVKESKGASTSKWQYPGGMPPTPPPNGGGGGGPLPPGPIPLPPPLALVTPADRDRPLMPKATLDRIRKMATIPTQQWADTAVPLDRQMELPIYGDYQGSELHFLPDYAALYVALKDDFPEQAFDYADKAIAGIRSALHNYKKGPNQTCAYLEPGDGSKKTFTIPHGDFVPASFQAYLATNWEFEITRTKPITYPPPVGIRNTDDVQYYSLFLSVVGLDGTVYIEGTDWRHNSDLPNNAIDWSSTGKPGQKVPALGSKYKVTGTTVFGAHPEAMTLDAAAKTFTFPTAPRADQTVFVEYLYGQRTAGFGTLSHQQTSENTGGFNSITIDATYTSRHLGKNVALALAWLKGYAGLSQALIDEACTMLVKWSDFAGSPYAYLWNSGASNYSMGHYVSRCLSAAALKEFGHPDAARVLADVKAWRQQYIVPILVNPTSSLAGGFWSEGWSYGSLAVQNLLEGSLSLEYVGVSIVAERQWAGDCVRHLLAASPSGVGTSQSMVLGSMGAQSMVSPPEFPMAKNMLSMAEEDHSDPWHKPFAGLQISERNLDELTRAAYNPSPLRAFADHCAANGRPVLPTPGGSRMALTAAPALPATVYDGGDWFAYPAPFPGKTLFAVLGAMAADPVAASYASLICRGAGTPISGWESFCFDDPARPAATWEAEPLEWFCSGTGLLTARESWAA